MIRDKGKINRFFSSCLCVLALLAGFIVDPCRLWAGEEKLLFLPGEPAFVPLRMDPREPHYGLEFTNGANSYVGTIGSSIELLQWRPADQSRWGFGVLGCGYIGLGNADYTDYPARVVHYNGYLLFNAFPERASDWQMGVYASESSGFFSNRVEYVHFSGHLGDELFDYVQRFIYTRESIRFTSSFQPWDELRLYAEAGYWIHIYPVEPPFFLHGGMELYSSPVNFLFGTVGRVYFGYDLKIKDEAGGVVNQNFQLGFQWKWKKESQSGLRLALLYYNGNSEFGEFYTQRDNHWGFGIYFDP